MWLRLPIGEKLTHPHGTDWEAPTSRAVARTLKRKATRVPAGVPDQRAEKRHSVNIDTQSRQGETAVMCAARNAKKELVAILLDVQAMVDLKNADGKTALMMASDLGFNGIVSCLLMRRAEVNMLDNDGRTALMHVSQKPQVAILRELLNHRADADLVDNEGNTALMLATRKDTNTRWSRHAVFVSDAVLSANVDLLRLHTKPKPEPASSNSSFDDADLADLFGSEEDGM